MPDFDYELIVIGGGPAGEKGAAQAAYFGHKTIVIEAYRELGGACINWGTLASKTLRESALFLSGFRTRQLGEGLNVQFKADITLNSFMYRKNLVQRREQERAARNLAASWHNIARMTGCRAHRRSQHGPGHLSRRLRERGPRKDHSRRHRLDSGAA